MVDLAELWSYKRLILFFTWRDLIVRYRQTVFGVLWLVLRPLTMTLLLGMVFRQLDTEVNSHVSYPLYVISGYLCWQFMSSSAAESGNSLINNITSINKVYYPRIVLPLSSILTNMIEFYISVVLLVVGLLFLNTLHELNVGWLLISSFLLISVTIGAGLLLSSLFVKFRDLKFVLPFLLQVGILLSPIGYQPTALSALNPWLLFINPVTAPMELFRYALFGQTSFLVQIVLFISILQTVVLGTIGLKVFDRIQKNLADTI